MVRMGSLKTDSGDVTVAVCVAKDIVLQRVEGVFHLAYKVL